MLRAAVASCSGAGEVWGSVRSTEGHPRGPGGQGAAAGAEVQRGGRHRSDVPPLAGVPARITSPSFAALLRPQPH